MDQARFRLGSLVGISQAIVRKTRQHTGAAALQVTLVFASIGPAAVHAQELSTAAAGLVSTIQALQDNNGLPYVVVDKLEARVFVYDERGTLVATTAALLGLARGDHSVPGIGERPLAKIRPEERTTPSGRFEAETGRNATGEHVLWIDYDAALSLHRVRNDSNGHLHRRLASATPDDNRTSYGCVTVPVPFYQSVIRPLFAGGKGVVYILPETKGWQQAIYFQTPLSQLMRVSNSTVEY